MLFRSGSEKKTGYGVDSGDYGNEEMVPEDIAQNLADNNGEVDKSSRGYVIVIAVGVLVAGVVGLLAVRKKRDM